MGHENQITLLPVSVSRLILIPTLSNPTNLYVWNVPMYGAQKCSILNK